MTSTSTPDVRTMKDEISNLETSISNASSREQALELAIQAAELCMRALKVAVVKEDKSELSSKCKTLLKQAEDIKLQPSWERTTPRIERPLQKLPSDEAVGSSASRTVVGRRLVQPLSTRSQSKAEQIIVLKASKLNGTNFPPWQKAPGSDQFDIGEDGLFEDSIDLNLSSQQEQLLDGWKRPADALPPPAWPEEGNARSRPTMRIDRTVDLVQDAATDCSVVASLCSATARGERGHARLLANIMYPYSHDERQPAVSANGKYVLKLNFNGSYRRVTIDDRLPVSQSRHILHVIDRNNRSLLWPALVEKAYLKVRGGYGFPGSNPSTDLWVIIGWIPEHVFMQDDGLDPDALWRRLTKAHDFGDVLVNLGTGPMSRKVERNIGLASQHAYAVLDLMEKHGQRMLLVKNPWSEGESWRGYTGDSINACEPNTDESSNLDWHGLQPPGATSAASPTFPRPEQQMTPGTFWIDLNKVMQHFESIYLNWNPGLFSSRQDIHFSWDLTSATKRGSAGCCANHPQFAVSAEKSGVLWLLLSRHFKNSTFEAGDSPRSGSPQIDLDGHISLSVHDEGGKKIYTGNGSGERGPFVDSPQTLLRMEASAGKTYTVVVAEQELSSTVHTFTLSAFALSSISLEEAPERYRHSQSASASWTPATSGGNATSPTYSRNPQISIEVANATPLMLLLETPAPNLNVHIKLVHSSDGKRISRPLRRRDILGDSGDYRKQSCIAELPVVEPGSYVVIASTFEPNQQAWFSLRADTNTPIKVKTLLGENAGRLPVQLRPIRFPVSASQMACRLQPRKTCNVLLEARLVQSRSVGSPGTPGTSASPIKLTLYFGRPYARESLAWSNGGEFAEILGPVRTGEVDLWPDMQKQGELWLVLERLTSGSGTVDEQYSLEMWVEGIVRPEEAVEVGPWREWEGD